MKKVIRIDIETKLFVEDVIISDNETTPNDCIETLCESGFYHPKWDGVKWIEGLTQEEITRPTPKKTLSEIDQLWQLVGNLYGLDVRGE